MVAGSGISKNSILSVHREPSGGLPARLSLEYEVDDQFAFWLVYLQLGVLTIRLRKFIDFLLKSTRLVPGLAQASAMTIDLPAFPAKHYSAEMANCCVERLPTYTLKDVIDAA
ncbi:MAG: hypothetical protein JXQ99_00840 [Hyphomicrobiaceae bacterium]